MVQGCSLLHMTTSGVCRHVTVCITEVTQIVMGRLYYTEVGATTVYSAFAYLWFIILHSISCFLVYSSEFDEMWCDQRNNHQVFLSKTEVFRGFFFLFIFFYTLCCCVLWHVLLLLLAQIRLPQAILQMCRCTHSPKLM